jgi:hypothetical protein
VGRCLDCRDDFAPRTPLSLTDPSPTSPRPQALTEPLLPNKVSWIVARFGGAEGRRPPAKAAFNSARRLSEQLLRYPLNGVGAELRQAVAERQEVFEGR